MIGYIYKTTIKNKESSLDGFFYIGKRQKSEFDKNYYGSGKILKDYKKRYKNKGLCCEILEEADSLEELNKLEKLYIKKYKNFKNNLNIAEGGVGGNIFDGLTKEEQEIFRKRTSEGMKRRWEKLNKKERSELVKKMIKNRKEWGNKGKKFSEEWKKKQSEGIKKFYQENQERVQEIRDKIKATKSTEEYKNKYHDSRVKMWQNPEYRKHRKELSERRKNERK